MKTALLPKEKIYRSRTCSGRAYNTCLFDRPARSVTDLTEWSEPNVAVTSAPPVPASSHRLLYYYYYWGPWFDRSIRIQFGFIYFFLESGKFFSIYCYYFWLGSDTEYRWGARYYWDKCADEVQMIVIRKMRADDSYSQDACIVIRKMRADDSYSF